MSTVINGILTDLGINGLDYLTPTHFMTIIIFLLALNFISELVRNMWSIFKGVR